MVDGWKRAWACRSRRCGGLFADFDFDLVILDDF